MSETDVDNSEKDLQPRLAGPIGEKNFYALFQAILLPLAMFRFWGERSRWLRAVAVMAVGIIGLSVALTLSRGAFVGVALMLVVMTCMRYIKPYQLICAAVGGGVLLLAMPQYSSRLSSISQLSSIVDRGGAGIADTDDSTQSRVTEMLTAAVAFADHPIVGVGPGMFKYRYPDYARLIATHPRAGNRAAHDLYLDIAAETGAAGLICFALMVFLTLRNLASVRKRYVVSRPELANMATGFMLVIVTFLTVSIFLSFAYVRYFWLVMALAEATRYCADGQGSEAGRVRERRPC